jgi:5-methylcytosine-specific restriction endonuclease McrA
MKNIKFYQNDTFQFHKGIIDSKKNRKADLTFKDRLNSYNPNIKILFQNYNTKFLSNSLAELNEFGYEEEKKKTLLQLYTFQGKKFQALKVELTTKEGNIVDNTCQNCTLSEVNSFDHILPKDDFPEFVVNPKNLFPSCTNCNSRKGTTWRENGKSIFLNLYTDILPNEQYLFVDIEIENSELKLTYYLDNKNQIDSELYVLIETHYRKLGLCHRFKENSDIVVSELENEINEYKDIVPIENIKEIIEKKCKKDRELLGFNYWKSILRLALINHDEYMSQFL